MNRRISSVIAFSSTAAAATLAATVMASSALADDITIDTTPFVSTKTRAEVRAELFAQRDQFSASSEWALQQPGPYEKPRPDSGYTREQARAEYIAARDEVHAMNSEDSGSATLAQIHPRKPSGNMLAKSSR